MSGWFAMKRGLHDHPVFLKQPLRVAVWSWMVATAAWKPTRFRVDGKIITLERGQLCVSQHQISDATGVGRQVIRSLLEDLEAEKSITKQSANGSTKGRTIITICNYDKYQSAISGSNQEETKEPTKRQPTKEQGNKDITLDANASKGADAPSTVEVSVVSSAVWAAGKQFLASRGVDNPGAMIGRWLKSHSPLALLGAIESAQKAGTHDPVPYITQALSGKQEGFSVKFDLSKFEASK